MLPSNRIGGQRGKSDVGPQMTCRGGIEIVVVGLLLPDCLKGEGIAMGVGGRGAGEGRVCPTGKGITSENLFRKNVMHRAGKVK